MTLAVVLGSLLGVALAELLWPRRRREYRSLRRRLGNVGIWLLNLVLAAFVFGSPVAFRSQLAATWGVSLPAWPIGNAAVSFVAGFVLLDALQYAIHRCQHAMPVLWRLHALHHSDPDVDVTTSVRHHPIEYLIATAIYWPVVLALDIPAAVVLGHGLTVFAAAAVTHGNMRIPEWLERLLQPVVITLDLHLVHHSIVQQQANSNFGAVLSIWDRLLGTFTPAPRKRIEHLAFGVTELRDTDCLKLSGMLLTPWRLGRAAADPAG